MENKILITAEEPFRKSTLTLQYLNMDEGMAIDPKIMKNIAI